MEAPSLTKEMSTSKKVDKKGKVLMSCFPLWVKSSCFFYIQTYVWAIAESVSAVLFTFISTD